jgi:hypothetical protein
VDEAERKQDKVNLELTSSELLLAQTFHSFKFPSNSKLFLEISLKMRERGRSRKFNMEPYGDYVIEVWLAVVGHTKVGVRNY